MRHRRSGGGADAGKDAALIRPSFDNNARPGYAGIKAGSIRWIIRIRAMEAGFGPVIEAL